MSETKQLDLFNKDVRDKDISSITRLFREVKQFRKSSEFKKKLDFYSSFPYLGVYNAALVEQQRPGARMVLTIKKWNELYNRRIKLNARPVIILMPFYPVEFLFDISDTKPIDNKRKNEENEIIEHIIRYNMKSYIHDIGTYLNNLDDNLPKYGINYNSCYVVGSEIRAEIRQDSSEELSVMINRNHYVEHHNYFTISVNMYANTVERLVCVIHELGHLFCQHIQCLWWDSRQYLTKEIKEFEAETVSYLVCKRLGIHSDSMEYLANYLEENEEIPPIDINYVFDAVDLIEQIVNNNRDVTKCLLYKKDSAFKEKVDREKQKIKEEQEKSRILKTSY